MQSERIEEVKTGFSFFSLDIFKAFGTGVLLCLLCLMSV